ncbi:MAG: class I SAM-dependent methyltransferase [Heliobacteriaceae bacterium]|nr:class I SAM-dependent methyltransferase [Heliobacteriaceae bacterium]
MRPFFSGNSCLEMGCADGGMTRYLSRDFTDIVAVDGSPVMLNRLRQAVEAPNLLIVESELEHLRLDRKFSNVVVAHVLEHVQNPVQVLRVAYEHLLPDGQVFITVPNGLSLHRKLGKAMGLISVETALTAADLQIGHRRVYVWDTLRADVAAAGLVPIHEEGVFLKPFTNEQMELLATRYPTILTGLEALGKQIPDLASELLIIAAQTLGPGTGKHK